jgi:hypothetical protein
MKEGKDIDRFFKDKLENPDIPFDEMDWDRLDERLYPKPKKNIVPIIWLSAIAGIAAMLVLALLVFRPDERIDKKGTVVRVKIKEEKDTSSEGKKSITEDSLNRTSKESFVKGNSQRLEILNEHPFVALPNIDVQNKSNDFMSLSLLALPESNVNQVALNRPVDSLTFDEKLASLKIARPAKSNMKDIIVKRKPVLILSILAAPDLTSVQQSGRSRLSGGFGIEATLSISKKLSVTTGAVYAKKIYDSDFSLYNPNTSYVFRNAPSNIHANCDVIDIPLNVNYKVFENRKNSLSVSTGLSSYLMLKEKYNYSYDGNYQGPQAYEVRNQNQHYLGVANVGLEFQHKINEKLSISAKPFMKLPLTGIGYGNSRLSSTGVAVSVNMNLFKKGN